MEISEVRVKMVGGNKDDRLKAFCSMTLDNEFVMAYVTLANLMKKKGEKKGFERYSKNALSLLSNMAPDAPVPHSEGVAAEMLSRMLTTGSI